MRPSGWGLPATHGRPLGASAGDGLWCAGGVGVEARPAPGVAGVRCGVDALALHLGGEGCVVLAPRAHDARHRKRKVNHRDDRPTLRHHTRVVACVCLHAVAPPQRTRMRGAWISRAARLLQWPCQGSKLHVREPRSTAKTAPPPAPAPAPAWSLRDEPQTGTQARPGHTEAADGEHPRLASTATCARCKGAGTVRTPK